MIPVFNPIELQEVSKLLSSSQKIVITTHFKPDGDAMGSSLALYNYLVKKKHKVKVVVPNEYPEFLQWMHGNDKVVNYEHKKKAAEKLLAEAGIIFCLDYNEPSRVEHMQQAVIKSPAKKVLIDHHLKPASFCNYTFSFPDACATCELIYYFIKQLGDEKRITKEIAECIYTGIMTDTGSFRFESMTADTHTVIAALLKTGINHARLHENIFDTYSEDRTRFLGYCIKDKMQVIKHLSTAYIALSASELEQYNVIEGDTEGVVNYPLSIKGIKLAAFFTERDDIIKISFRSKGTFSVRDFAHKHFKGGGHKNAAGGKSELSLDETVEKFVALLELYRNELSADNKES